MPSLKKSLKFYSDDVPGACSLYTIYCFDSPSVYTNSSSFIPPSKTGLYVVMFTDKVSSKEMYHALREIMDIEYQSVPTMGNEGNMVFVCIFKERT